MPKAGSRFISIGLTNGPAGYVNPCIVDQVKWAKDRHLWTTAYAFTTLPNARQRNSYGRTGPWTSRSMYWTERNAAYKQALLNLSTMKQVGLRTPIVWLDIETEPYLEKWGKNIKQHRAVINAAILAYRRAGYRIGFYSSDYEWAKLTGSWQRPEPVIVTVGRRGKAAALRKCPNRTYSGGRAVLTQWFDKTRDYDATCPGITGDAKHASQVRRYFSSN
ncbi:hypothetical protein KRM28CT15_42970 [Krasilnikovia sp. M28-CT-15]